MLFLLVISVQGCTRGRDAEDIGSDTPWSEIVSTGRGTRVYMMMWTGDPLINRYMREYVSDVLSERYDMTLDIISGQGGQIVSTIITEMEADARESAADLVWINGETFYQLRQVKALFGPFVRTLPNSRFVDFENPFINRDFQQKIDGFESPWGNVQFVMIYDEERTPNPPRNRDELADWIVAHPGRFTFDSSFTGMTFLKALLISFADSSESLYGPFDEEAYSRTSERLWAYLEGLRPYFWMQGETYPSSVARLHQLFLNREVDFTMSNNDAEVDNKVSQGLFEEVTRAYVMDEGSIRNSHFLGIPKHAANKAGAMILANFLLSPEAQLRKLDPAVWGDGSVLNRSALPDSMASAFEKLETHRFAPPRKELESRALEELDAKYMIRLYEDFRTHMVER